MLKINQITDDPSQTQRVLLPDGDFFTLSLYFRPMQLGWWISELTYNSFTLRGLRITTNPNMLFQYQNLIPFGIACVTSGNREPSQLQDFSSGAATLYVLTQIECQQYATLLAGVPTWNSSFTYATGALVIYLGVNYVSLVDSNTGNVPTNTAFWGSF